VFFWQINDYSKSLRISIIEGMFFSIMNGAGAVFLIPFALFLGASNFDVGLLIAIPVLFAAWLQLGALKLLRICGKRRMVVVITDLLQSVSWLLVAATPFLFPNNQILFLIIFASLASIFGTIGTPLWQSWMQSITPKKVLGKYFGIRNAILGIVAFLTMLACGFYLKLITTEFMLLAFILIFLLSFAGRLVSGIIANKIEEPPIIVKKETIHIFAFIKQLGKNNFGHFVLFGTLMSFTLAMTGTFFSVYLLTTLGLSSDYMMYIAIISASVIGSVVSMTYWGKIIDMFGAVAILRATTIVLILHPLLLIFVRDPVLLLPVEFLNGIILSGISMALGTFIYGAYHEEKIIKYSSYQSTLFGTATFVGIMIASVIMTMNFSYQIISTGFYAICLLVAIMRVGIYLLMKDKVNEYHEMKQIKIERLVMGILSFGPVTEPILTRAKPFFSAAQNLTLKEMREMQRLAVNKLTFAEKAALKIAWRSRKESAEDLETNILRQEKKLRQKR